MLINSVIFDYGCVISVVPTLEDYEPLRQAIGVDHAIFHEVYWRDRDAYDLDTLSATTYWQAVGRAAGLEFAPAKALELAELDCHIWGRSNPVIVEWLKVLSERRIQPALISNISSHVAGYLRRTSAWISLCNPAIFSGEIKLLKPDAAIFHACLESLGQPPKRTLFIDDREVNVTAARALGINSIVFQSVDQLRTDLEPYGLGESLTEAQTRVQKLASLN